MAAENVEIKNVTLELLKSHRSIRNYAEAPVPEKDIRDAVEAAQMAATSSNLQAYCLLQVTDPAKREKLVELTGGQPYVGQAGAFFVVCGDARRHALLCQAHGEKYSPTMEKFMVTVIDASLFAQNLSIAFEAMGYGTCYIGGLRSDLPAVDKLLNIPHGVYPLFGLCVGEPEEDPDSKPRLPMEAVLYKDSFPDDAALAETIAEYDRKMEQYYEERTGKKRNWSFAVVRNCSSPGRTATVDYYRSKGAAV